MSIIGAIGAGVGAGVGIGVAVNEFIFRYSKAEYQQKINELQGYLDVLDMHLGNLTDLRGRMQNFWDDPKAQEVSIELNRTIAETRREMVSVRTYMQTLQNVVGELDTTGEKLDAAIDAMKSALSAGISG